MRRVVATAIGVAAAFGAAVAHAQSGSAATSQGAWPTKLVRVIVPFAAGSFTDIAARAIAAPMAENTGHPFTVENRLGAGGTIGADAVAKAAPDGHTLLLAENSFAMAASLYPKLPYDPVKGFAQVSMVAESPSLLVARPGLPARTLKELVDLARAHPEKLTFGTAGQGSTSHLATEQFLAVAGIRMTHVPFKGVAASITEVMADRIDIAVAGLASGMQQVRSGKVQGLGVSGGARSPLLPNVPTFAESGFAGYAMIHYWGVAAPAGTPDAVVDRINREIGRALARTDVREAFVAQGATAVASTPAELAKRVESEVRLWKDVVSRSGLKLE